MINVCAAQAVAIPKTLEERIQLLEKRVAELEAALVYAGLRMVTG